MKSPKKREQPASMECVREKPRRPYQGPYSVDLTDDEIAGGVHREAVGGMWDDLGRWQLDLLIGKGLQPAHRLLDVGCGALRGGIHFIGYLNPGNYYGIDINASLIKAGRDVELPRAGLTDRNPHLEVSEFFEFTKFGTTFPFALALSVFTHLPANAIETCLVRLVDVLEPGARFYATYFEATGRHALAPIQHPAGIVTYSDSDPFHYHYSWFEFLAAELPLSVKNLGDCQHSRGQHLLEFVRV
jgi:SAM-dependent methyltransferase